MPDIDLVDLIVADHDDLLALDEDDVVTSITKHLALERALLYPAIERYLPNGKGLVAEMHRIDRVLEQGLEELESDQSEEENLTVAKDLLAHIDGQRDALDALKRTVAPERLQELTDQVPLILATAPHRPHLHAPDHGSLGEIASEIDARIDQAEEHP
jgi:hypothetical protein